MTAGKNRIMPDYYTPFLSKMQGETLVAKHFCGLCQFLCKHCYVNRVNRRCKIQKFVSGKANVAFCPEA